jgi:hypothetical protein
MDRIKDKGPSVRRRVIKILGDICTNVGDQQRDILIAIMQRSQDDAEGIKDAVLKTFETILFG